ncbi:hypothetical protein EFP20_19475 [Burkholderia glumae]|nr:hypothetical protein CEQ24_019780 [Burkholderia glumae]UVS90101.1 hypothetical protein EFP17_10115 [Burkholderia glumae]UVT03576.1 hypothetical protein EFP20_19475 [Burkholderia glumae]
MKSVSIEDLEQALAKAISDLTGHKYQAAITQLAIQPTSAVETLVGKYATDAAITINLVPEQKKQDEGLF